MRKPTEQEFPKHVLRAHFSDLDEFVHTVRGWDISFVQLDRGPLEVGLFQVGIGPVVLGRYSFNRRFDQRGGSPPGVRTFGLVDPPGVTWCGRLVDAATLFVFPASDYESVSPSGFLGRSLSVTENHLNTIALSLGLPTIEELAGYDDFAIHCDPGAMASLRTSIENLYHAFCASPSLLDHLSLYKELNYDLPAQLLCALSQSLDTPIALPKFRHRAVRFAKAHIAASQGDVTIEELCRVSGVSWRTLNYAFKDHLGVSPKTYLQAFRLNHVRRELVLAPTDAKVAAIANNWGFWHLGQFAKDYRKFFGELPSETRHRSTLKRFCK